MRSAWPGDLLSLTLTFAIRDSVTLFAYIYLSSDDVFFSDLACLRPTNPSSTPSALRAASDPHPDLTRAPRPLHSPSTVPCAAL